ncbi:GNAT family N-acetyltransferase [Nonomuraea sp. JJY05]|uniref:GNAT family N-acetyltransferase n=1 Tax=Nonomuraea sp. JJY05 TaxID=3350255 RepID=UPI00373EBA86
MAGVAGVTVSPEDRGRGVGSRLMRAVVERAASLGDAVSALHPATTPIYRSVGYEPRGPTATLRLSGLMSSDDRYDEALDTAFAARRGPASARRCRACGAGSRTAPARVSGIPGLRRRCGGAVSGGPRRRRRG